MARKKAIPRPSHPSLKALPKLKGGYYRRIKDIPRALDEIRLKELPEVIQFLILFFGCEKLALGMMGVNARFASETPMEKGSSCCCPS
jgi:hypothetical protein